MSGTIDRPVTRLYLDTNVLIALAEGSDELSELLWDMSSTNPGNGFLCTSELTLAELAVLPYRDRKPELLRLYDGWFTSHALFAVARVDRTVLLGAAFIRGRHPGTRLPDAIHLATAASMGCSHILSADRRIPDEFKIETGEDDVYIAPAALSALRPDRPTLEAIIRKAAES
jgi:predicted nucleic acid-binding protein